MMTTGGMLYEATCTGGKFEGAHGIYQRLTFNELVNGLQWPKEPPAFTVLSTGVPTSNLFIDWNIRYIIPINQFDYKGNPDNILIEKIQQITGNRQLRHNPDLRTNNILEAVREYEIRCRQRDLSTKPLPQLYEYDAQIEPGDIAPIKDPNFNNLKTFSKQYKRTRTSRKPTSTEVSPVSADGGSGSKSFWEAPMTIPQETNRGSDRFQGYPTPIYSDPYEVERGQRQKEAYRGALEGTS